MSESMIMWVATKPSLYTTLLTRSHQNMRGTFDFEAKCITAWCVNKHCTHEQKCAAFNKEHAGTVHVIKMLNKAQFVSKLVHCCVQLCSDCVAVL